jgi:hypothetical protein
MKPPNPEYGSKKDPDGEQAGFDPASQGARQDSTEEPTGEDEQKHSHGLAERHHPENVPIVVQIPQGDVVEHIALE